MACYRLKRPWALRGWDKLPYALVDADAKRTLFVSRPEFEALALCDGSVDTDWGFVAPATRDLVRKIAERDFVEPCADGASVEDWQRYRTYDCRYVKMAHWSVTGRCNYRCKHCYMSAPDAKYGELSHETCMRVIDELADCGVYRMSITGGEPLVRADFWELVDHMLERGMRIMVIYSNGALVDDAPCSSGAWPPARPMPPRPQRWRAGRGPSASRRSGPPAHRHRRLGGTRRCWSGTLLLAQ